MFINVRVRLFCGVVCDVECGVVWRGVSNVKWICGLWGCVVLWCGCALCCAALCCAVLSVLRCSLLCSAAPRCAALRCDALHCTVLCCAMLRYAVPFSAVLCCAMQFSSVLCCAVLYYAYSISTSDGILLRKGRRLGKITDAQPPPPFFSIDHNLGNTAFLMFTWSQQSCEHKFRC